MWTVTSVLTVTFDRCGQLDDLLAKSESDIKALYVAEKAASLKREGKERMAESDGASPSKKAASKEASKAASKE